MNCSRTHDSRMIDYSAVTMGQLKLSNALYQYILGIRGRRTEGVTRNALRKFGFVRIDHRKLRLEDML